MRLINAQGKRRHVKHYLTSLRSMQEEMRAKQERIMKLRALAEGLSSAMGECVSGGVRRDLADVKQEIGELTDEYAGDLSRYASEIAEGYRICPSSDLPRYICWLHWAEDKTWGQVGAKVGYSGSHCAQNLADEGVEGIYADMPHHWHEAAEKAL